MRRYELMLLLRPDLEDDKLQAAVEKVTRAIVNAGGSLTKVSPWGKRRLAYDIQRHREASYFLIHFDIEPGAVREIERGMLISEEILRHLVTVLEDRGPAEELAPAAAARELDGGAATDRTVEPSGSSEPASTPAVEADAASPAESAGDAAPSEDVAPSDDAAPSEDTIPSGNDAPAGSVAVEDGEADNELTEEDRAEA